jgi:hypothetical protein
MSRCRIPLRKGGRLNYDNGKIEAESLGSIGRSSSPGSPVRCTLTGRGN